MPLECPTRMEHPSAEQRDPRQKQLDVLLHLWRDWMRSGTWVEGYPSTAPGFNVHGYITDFDTIADAAEHQVAAAVGSCIEDLPMLFRLSIERVWLNSADPRLVDGDALWMAQVARESLIVKLVRRGVMD